MLQIVYAAATRIKAPEGQWGLVPVFMRAAELSALLSKDRAGELKTLLVDADETTSSLRELVVLFLANRYPQGVVQTMTELFDLKQLLICVDGLDEAAMHRAH